MHRTFSLLISLQFEWKEARYQGAKPSCSTATHGTRRGHPSLRSTVAGEHVKGSGRHVESSQAPYGSQPIPCCRGVGASIFLCGQVATHTSQQANQRETRGIRDGGLGVCLCMVPVRLRLWKEYGECQCHGANKHPLKIRLQMPVTAHETLQQRIASDIARSALRGSPQLDQPLPEQLLFQFSGPLLRCLLSGLMFRRT
jgi:hypothetical protein